MMQKHEPNVATKIKLDVEEVVGGTARKQPPGRSKAAGGGKAGWEAVS
jgi:hypothetical protein